jgi:hypothetical protein
LEITARSKTRNRQRNIRWITVAIISSILAISSWAVSSPIGSSPDDDFHLPSIWCGQGVRDDLCETSSTAGSYDIPFTTSSNSACFAFQKDVSAVCDYDNTLASQFNVNLIRGLYPPGFYWVMSWMSSPDIPLSTISMRIMNGIFTVLIMVVLLIALPRDHRRAPLLTIILTSIPLTIFLVASTNPSSWSYVGLLTLLTALAGFLSAKGAKSRISLGLIAALGFFMAVGSRADATPYAGLAIALAWILAGTVSRKSISQVLLTIALTTFIGIIYLLGGGAPSVLNGKGLQLIQEGRVEPSFFANLTRLPDLWAGVFGTWGLGWLDTPMPAIVWFSSLGIFLAVVFSAVKLFDSRQAIAFSLAIVGLIFVPMYILMSNGLSVGEQVQPRYLLPLIVFVAFTALYRSKGVKGLSLSIGQLAIAGAGLAIANAVALHTNLRRYLTGLDERGINLDAGIEWWWDSFPVSPNFVFILGASSFALFLFSVWKLRYTIGLTDDLTSTKQKDHSPA